jgi:hypothetical protein
MGYKGTIGKTNWSLGEISPRSWGRFDADKPIWKNGAAIIENMLIGQACSVANRPGTQYVGPVKNSANKSCLRRFTYSISQEYMMEIGNEYIRFFSNFNNIPGQVVVPAAPQWLTSTAYTIGQYVTESGVTYICIVAHTSGTFATDLAAGDWILQNAAPLWVTSTAYVVGDYVTDVSSGNVYYCVIAHTSGTFATDLAAQKWVLQNVLEIPTPFQQADIFNLQMAQKADVMYIVHPNYFPQKLIRTSATSFTLNPVPFFRGPFLDTNISATTITPSGATGSGITLTASDPIFLPEHVGSLWLVLNAVVLITGYTSSTVLTGNVQPELNVPAVPNAWGLGQTYAVGDYVSNGGTVYRCLVGNVTSGSSVFSTDLSAGYWIATSGSDGDIGTTSATTIWAEGAFSAVRGYPSTVTFHEGRLVYGATQYQPQTLYASASFAYDDFDTGTSQDADAYTYEIANQQSNGMRWLESDTALQIGTSGGTVSAADGNASTGITPSSPPEITYNDNYGVMAQQPVKLGGFVFFLTANGFYIRQLTFDLITSKYKAGNQMVLADHILRDGLGAVQMACQVSPYDRIWVVRADGQLAVFTRDPDQQVEGWSRLVGGESDGTVSCNGLSGGFETLDILPIDGQDDQIWVIVQRLINGSFVRWVEVFTDELFNNYWEPVRVDASLSYDNPLPITNITNTLPITVTIANHGYSNGDLIKLEGIIGMGGKFNDNVYVIGSVTTNTFVLVSEYVP